MTKVLLGFITQILLVYVQLPISFHTRERKSYANEINRARNGLLLLTWSEIGIFFSVLIMVNPAANLFLIPWNYFHFSIRLTNNIINTLLLSSIDVASTLEIHFVKYPVDFFCIQILFPSFCGFFSFTYLCVHVCEWWSLSLRTTSSRSMNWANNSLN